MSSSTVHTLTRWVVVETGGWPLPKANMKAVHTHTRTRWIYSKSPTHFFNKHPCLLKPINTTQSTGYDSVTQLHLIPGTKASINLCQSIEHLSFSLAPLLSRANETGFIAVMTEAQSGSHVLVPNINIPGTTLGNPQEPASFNTSLSHGVATTHVVLYNLPWFIVNRRCRYRFNINIDW